METNAALALLLSLLVLFGLGFWWLLGMTIRKGPDRASARGKGGGLFNFSSQQKGSSRRKIAPNDAIKERLEKTFADSASRTED